MKTLIDLRIKHKAIKDAFPNSCIDVVDRMDIDPVKDLIFNDGIEELRKLDCAGKTNHDAHANFHYISIFVCRRQRVSELP